MLRISYLYAPLFLVFWLLNALSPIMQIQLPAWLSLWLFIAAVCSIEFIRLIHRMTNPFARQHTFLILFFLFLVSWRLSQSAWSVDSITTILEVVKTAVLAIFVLAVYTSLSRMNRLDLERFAATVITAVLSVSCAAYFYLLVHHFGGLTYYGLQEVKRYALLFGGSNIAGAMLLVFGTWNWALILSETRWIKNLGLLNFAMAAVSLFGIASRTAAAGFLFAGAVMLIAVLWKKRRNIFVSLILIGSAASAVVGLTFFSSLIFEAHLTTLPTLLQRVNMWHDAWHVLLEGAWLFGTGVGTNGGLIFFTLGGDALRGGVHNALLQTWLEEGLLGLSLHIWLFIWLVRTGLSAPSRTGLALVVVASGIFFRNLGESNGLLWGLLNNFLVFASWLVIVHLLIYCIKDTHHAIEGAPLRKTSSSLTSTPRLIG